MAKADVTVKVKDPDPDAPQPDPELVSDVQRAMDQAVWKATHHPDGSPKVIAPGSIVA